MPRKIHVALCACLIATLAKPAYATEGGTQHYPIGVNTIADGNLPTPGMLQMLTYSEVALNPVLTDGSGNKAVAKFNLAVEAEAFRFLYTWDPQIGPFHYTTGLVAPIVNLDLNVMGARGHDLDMGDLDIQNYLGYASPDHSLFYFFGLDTYIPTGHYDKSTLINTGSNYYTFAPNIDVTYNLSPKWELTAALFAEFNTTNTADNYHSGDDMDLDYGVTYRPFDSLPNFGLGPQGYFYKQISDDTVNGATVSPNGNRGQEFAIGPQLRYDIPFGGFVLKYQQEYAVENRPKGEKIWFQFAMPLFGTPG
jgi:hypothetical protein